MISAVNIVNIALARLGADPISRLEDETKAARAANQMFEFNRDVLLGEYAWNFATKYEELTVVTGDHPVYQYIYGAPADMITPLYFANPDTKTKLSFKTNWEMEGLTIVTDITPACLKYVYRMEYATLYPTYFSDALAAILTAELAPTMTQDRKLYRQLIEIAEVKKNTAIEADANVDVTYVREDEDPNKDSFNYPDSYLRDEDLM